MNQSTSYDSPFKKAKRNIARANGYLRRNEFIKAMDAARKSFAIRPKLRLFGQEKIEMDFILMEFCDKFSANPGVIDFLKGIKIGVTPFLTYNAVPGGEKVVLDKLDIVCIRWQEKEKELVAKQRMDKAQRLTELLAKGQDCLDKGEFPRGKAHLRRAADDFGDNPGLLRDIGSRLAAKDLLPDALDFFSAAIQRDPSDAKAYSLAVNACREMGEMNKAEEIYLAAIRRFGGHPQTYLNLSKLYVQWRKRDKAYEFAKLALDADPKLHEAREIMREVG